MILDNTSIELSALHALDLLDPEERESFERDMRINPELAECSAEFRDLGAEVAVAGSGTLEAPPVTVLTGALVRIGAVKKPQPPRAAFFRGWPGVAAACAALFVLVGGGASVWNSVREKGGGAAAGERPRVAEQGSEDRVVIMRNGETLATLSADDRTIRDLVEKLNRVARLRHAPGVIQDIARLKRELQSLRKADAGRFSAGPRVARTVYIEMVEPGSEIAEDDNNLSERVRDAIATAIEQEVGVEQAGTSEPVGDVSMKDDEDAPVVIENEDSGVAPDLRRVGDGASVYYRDFPAGADHFERIDDGRVWDSANQRIWIETDEPGVYQAVAPPAGFDPDFIADYAAIVPVAGSLAGPATVVDEPAPLDNPESPASSPVAPIEAIEEPAEPAPPVAMTFYEQTTGRGTVVVGNLAPAGDGQVYQLWMRNLADDQVVSVGILPGIETGAESFDFDLLGPGITPAGFFITLEPEGGVDTPGETVILQGP